MQAEKIGERQLLLIAGVGLIIAQLILNYLGLGGRSLIKSFFWLLKNRYKLSLYLCIISVLVCRELYGQVTDQHWYLQFCYPALFFFTAGFAWFSKGIFTGKCSNTAVPMLAGRAGSLIQTNNTTQ